MSPKGKDFIFLADQACIDFVNTELIDQGQKVDLLKSFSDLIEWMVAAKMMTAAEAARAGSEWSSGKGLAALDGAKTFRRMMRQMVDQLADGRTVPQAALSEINRKLRAVSAFLQVVKRGRDFEKRVESEVREPADLLARIAESAAELVCNHDLSLVKKCKNPACILYFYDKTKNHRRNWCSMAICGNRMKVAAFYLRSRSSRSNS